MWTTGNRGSAGTTAGDREHIPSTHFPAGCILTPSGCVLTTWQRRTRLFLGDRRSFPGTNEGIPCNSVARSLFNKLRHSNDVVHKHDPRHVHTGGVVGYIQLDLISLTGNILRIHQLPE